MTTVGFGESSRYAFRLYAYVLAAFVAGAVGVGLGAALLWPAVQAWRGPGQAAVAPGVAGGLLVFLGLSVLTVGWLGTTYKLLADGVAAGHAENVNSDRDRQANAPETADSPTTPDRGTDRSAERKIAHDEQPPEPSPSEIAFGTEDDAGARNDGPLPGGDGAGDPLGERSE